jgi:hypothetical protein
MKLTSKQINRIEEYINYFEPMDVITPFEIDSLKTILKDGKYKSSVYKEFLNKMEDKYQSYICEHWVDDDGSFVYGKDVFNQLLKK